MMNIHGYTEPRKCRIKVGWGDAGKEGYCYGYINLEQGWGVVVWDDEEDPDLHKMAGLEELASEWRAFK